ncbi:nucleotidyltransferase family protein [bacterium]|nr:nucleotidyltransferase family protein [bacterium]
MTRKQAGALSESSPEGHLILDALRCRFDLTARQRLAEGVARGVDWPLVLEESRRRGLLPFVAEALRKHDLLGYVPKDLRTALEGYLCNLAAFSLLGRQVLEQVEEALAGRPHLMLRGPMLGEYLYGPDVPRPFSDLDVAVDCSDTEGIWTVAQALSNGRPFRTKWVTSRELDEYVLLSSAELTVEEAEELASQAFLAEVQIQVTPQVGVELKPYLSRYYQSAGDLEVSWPERVQVTWLGLQAGIPPAEILVAHLADHAAYHPSARHRLLPLVDIDALIRKQASFDWDACAERARQIGAQLPLLIALGTCRRVLATSVPEDLEGKLDLPRRQRRIGETVSRADVFTTGTGPVTPYAPLLELLRQPRRIPALRPGLQVRKLTRALFPSRAFVRWQYGTGPGAGRLVFGYLEHWRRQPQRALGRWWLPPRARLFEPPPASRNT